MVALKGAIMIEIQYISCTRMKMMCSQYIETFSTKEPSIVLCGFVIAKTVSEDQSAILRISFVDIPTFEAIDEDVSLTE